VVVETVFVWVEVISGRLALGSVPSSADALAHFKCAVSVGGGVQGGAFNLPGPASDAAAYVAGGLPTVGGPPVFAQRAEGSP
jgi:hypothetical protein